MYGFMRVLRKIHNKILLGLIPFIVMIAIPVRALAQVSFQPSNCEFSAVFVGPPDIKEITMPDESGKTLKSVIANLDVIVDGAPNFFRAECTEVQIPTELDQSLLLDDMKAIAVGNNLRDAKIWVEKSNLSGLVGRVRGEISDTKTTYVMDIHRYIGKHNIFDVWVGSPPGTFPSRGNLIFLKELKLNGRPIY